MSWKTLPSPFNPNTLKEDEDLGIEKAYSTEGLPQEVASSLLPVEIACTDGRTVRALVHQKSRSVYPSKG